MGKKAERVRSALLRVLQNEKHKIALCEYVEGTDQNEDKARYLSGKARLE